MIDEKFVIVGAVISFSGTISYILDTLKGRTKPNRVSWFLWGLAPMLAVAGELGEGVGLRSLMTFMAGFGPLLIFSASFVNKKAYWKLERFDLICGGLSLVGLILWLITREGFFAITFAILADGLAALPTIKKAYYNPESENYIAFLTSGISAGIALLTIDDWYYANWGFPLYILLICALMVFLVRFRIGKKFIKQHA